MKQDIIGDIDLNKIIAFHIPNTVACIVEIYWAPLSNRWVDRMAYPEMTRTVGQNNEAHMTSVMTMFNAIKNRKFKHITFYFVKYYSTTLKTEHPAIRLIGMYDTEMKKFYNRQVLNEFKNNHGGKSNFIVEPELMRLSNWNEFPIEEAKDRFRFFIELYASEEAVMIQTPTNMFIVKE